MIPFLFRGIVLLDVRCEFFFFASVVVVELRDCLRLIIWQ